MKRTRLYKFLRCTKIPKIPTMADKTGINSTEKPNTNSNDQDSETKTEDNNGPECAVCLQPCIHPAELPCKHIFCYLCVKGVTNQNKKCPMCRHDIPSDFVDRPMLVELDEIAKSMEATVEVFRWFYEGRNGWWQYDDRTSSELETAYKEKKTSCELLIAGFVYVADLSMNVQFRKDIPAKRRKIKRDMFGIPKKGVAGLRFNQQEEEPIVREIRGAERPATPTSVNTDVVDVANDDVGTPTSAIAT